MMNAALREEIAKLEQLEKHYENPTFEVVSSVFRTLSKKEIISADSFQRQVVVASLKTIPD
jgi:structure-specific recognition protein 1